MADYNLFIYHGNVIFNMTFNPIILLEEQETQCSHIFGPSVTRVLVRGQTGKPRKVGSGVKANHSHSVGLQVGALMTEKGWVYICREEILEYFLNLKNWKYIFIQIDSLLMTSMPWQGRDKLISQPILFEPNSYKWKLRDFPAHPVVKALCIQCRGSSFDS